MCIGHAPSKAPLVSWCLRVTEEPSTIAVLEDPDRPAGTGSCATPPASRHDSTSPSRHRPDNASRRDRARRSGSGSTCPAISRPFGDPLRHCVAIGPLPAGASAMAPSENGHRTDVVVTGVGHAPSGLPERFGRSGTAPRVDHDANHVPHPPSGNPVPGVGDLQVKLPTDARSLRRDMGTDTRWRPPSHDGQAHRTGQVSPSA